MPSILCLLLISYCYCSIRIQDTGVRQIVEGPSGAKIKELNLTNCVRVSDVTLLRIAQRSVINNLPYTSIRIYVTRNFSHAEFCWSLFFWEEGGALHLDFRILFHAAKKYHLAYATVLDRTSWDEHIHTFFANLLTCKWDINLKRLNTGGGWKNEPCYPN